MYKFRLGSWGLRKNLGETTVKQTIEGLGDGPASFMPDNKIRKKLERYFIRKPDILQELQGSHQATLQTLLKKAPGRGVSTGTPWTRLRPLRPSPSTTLRSPSNTLRAPTQLQLPDEIFRFFSAFLSSLTGESAVMTEAPPEQDESSTLPTSSFHHFPPLLLYPSLSHIIPTLALTNHHPQCSDSS